MTDKTKDDTQWHLDKRIPITLIVAIVIQTLGAFWWAATVDATIESIGKRVSSLEMTNRRQYDLIAKERENSHKVAAGLAEVKGQLVGLNTQVSRIAEFLMTPTK